MNRQDVINGMRDLLDFLESRPDLPLPGFEIVDIWAWNRPDFTRLAKIFGSSKKVGKEFTAHYVLEKKFGPVKLHLSTIKEVMCKKVVVGYEEVPARDAYIKEVVEWQCQESILGGEDEEHTGQDTQD